MQTSCTPRSCGISAALLGLATLALLGLAGAQAVQAQTAIDTTPQSTGQSRIISWGVTDTSTYGQTFVAPSDNVLNNFTFYLGSQVGGSGPIQFQANVYAWDGTKAVGSALFTSAPQSYTPVSSGYTPVFTSTGITFLTVGQQYVAFLTTAGLQAGRPDSRVSWEATDGYQDAYSGGQFVYINCGNDASQLTSSPWTTNILGSGDLAFQMNFRPSAPVSPTPEPSTVTVMALGVLGLAGLAFKARKRKLTM